MPASSGPGFSPGTAAIFIFNLVVGTGALALPNAFEQVESGQVILIRKLPFVWPLYVQHWFVHRLGGSWEPFSCSSSPL